MNSIRMNGSMVMRTIAAIAFMLSLSGCVSIYSNSNQFDPAPHVGMTEMDLIQTYGAPDYAGFVEDQKIYVYKVRDSKFIIALGQYNGYDMVITTKGGIIKDTRRLPRGQAVTFLYAAPWMGHD